MTETDCSIIWEMLPSTRCFSIFKGVRWEFVAGNDHATDGVPGSLVGGKLSEPELEEQDPTYDYTIPSARGPAT